MSKRVMTDREVLERFAQIVAKSLHIPAERVTADATLEELGAESLDLVEITMEVETEFNVWFPEKTILHVAESILGTGVLLNDGALTDEGKRFLLRRMPELTPEELAGDFTLRDLMKIFSKVTTWIRIIQGLREFTPWDCTACGGELQPGVNSRMKCAQCAAEQMLLSGDEINKRWVQEHYAPEYAQRHGAVAQTMATVQS